MRTFPLVGFALALLMPALAHAASLKELTASIVKIVDTAVVPLIYSLAFILFLIGMVRYFFLEQGEEGRDKGKALMVWGIAGLVVMFSVWGIVRLFMTALPG